MLRADTGGLAAASSPLSSASQQLQTAGTTASGGYRSASNAAGDSSVLINALTDIAAATDTAHNCVSLAVSAMSSLCGAAATTYEGTDRALGAAASPGINHPVAH